jgi:hypothetical protein
VVFWSAHSPDESGVTCLSLTHSSCSWPYPCPAYFVRARTALRSVKRGRPQPHTLSSTERHQPLQCCFHLGSLSITCLQQVHMESGWTRDGKVMCTRFTHLAAAPVGDPAFQAVLPPVRLLRKPGAQPQNHPRNDGSPRRCHLRAEPSRHRRAHRHDTLVLGDNPFRVCGTRAAGLGRMSPGMQRCGAAEIEGSGVPDRFVARVVDLRIRQGRETCPTCRRSCRHIVPAER